MTTSAGYCALKVATSPSVRLVFRRVHTVMATLILLRENVECPRVHVAVYIERAASIVFSNGKAEKNVQGQIASALKPAVLRYNDLSEEERYQVRRKVRSFCKWYSYITQVVRTFDKDLNTCIWAI